MVGEILKVGLTGQRGFIGSHLFNLFNISDNTELISFEREFFNNPESLENFVKRCDVIVHLAGMNRHPDENVLYDTNLLLVDRLIEACQNSGSTPHIVFSSSVQENLDNPYGRSKLEGAKRFQEWASKSGGKFTSLKIPNVFGPFCKPFYNSVVATFCHMLTNNEEPNVIEDKELDLIYVGELAEYIVTLIHSVPQPIGDGQSSSFLDVQPSFSLKVSEILSILSDFRNDYLKHGEIPDISRPYLKWMFLTFHSYIPSSFYPVKYQEHADERGSFLEIAKIKNPGQVSFSTTVPNVTRGNHFHTRKFERFSVIEGKAVIRLRRIGTEEIVEYELDGETPGFVDIPIWWTHNIENVGDTILKTIFWINEPYVSSDADTFVEIV